MKWTRKGFTLVEIMIVVVIIALLAALAIPAFIKVRRSSVKTTMVNDGRQLSSAAQQYFLENSVTRAPYTELVGTQNGTNGKYLKSLSKGVGFVTASPDLDIGGTFALTHANFGTLAVGVDNGNSVAETVSQ